MKWGTNQQPADSFRRAVADALRDYKAYSAQVMGAPDAAVQLLIGKAIAYGRDLEAAGMPRPRIIVGSEPERRPLPDTASAN